MFKYKCTLVLLAMVVEHARASLTPCSIPPGDDGLQINKGSCACGKAATNCTAPSYCGSDGTCTAQCVPNATGTFVAPRLAPHGSSFVLLTRA